MNSDRRFPKWQTAICAGVLLCSGLTANAQHRTVVMAPPAAVQPRQTLRPIAIPQGAHVVTSAPIVHPPSRPHLPVRSDEHASVDHRGDHRGSTNRNFTCANGANLTVQQLIDPFPSNGFNFEHLNAIDSDLAIKAAIDPATELAVNEARRLNCGIGGAGGYVLFGGGYAVPQEMVQDAPDDSDAGSSARFQVPQVIVVQVPTAAPATATKSVPEVQEEGAPLPDQRPFVLVMRDGSKVQTTAFTRTADQIVYISLDGLRHAIPLASLDADATIELNSEHGSQIQLPL